MESKMIGKVVLEKTEAGSACMCCHKIESVFEDAHCSVCNLWYHLECGTQKKQGMFTCPKCNASSKLVEMTVDENKEVKNVKKIGRPRKKQKIN